MGASNSSSAFSNSSSSNMLKLCDILLYFFYLVLNVLQLKLNKYSSLTCVTEHSLQRVVLPPICGSPHSLKSPAVLYWQLTIRIGVDNQQKPGCVTIILIYLYLERNVNVFFALSYSFYPISFKRC